MGGDRRVGIEFVPVRPYYISVKGTRTEAIVDARFRVSTDVVVFTIRGDALKVLLRGMEPEVAGGDGGWALPGGFVADGEALDDSARRALLEHTGLTRVYLEQLYTFGQPERHPGRRVISVAYFALVPGDQLAGFEPDRFGAWWDASRLPPLYLDHESIICTARKRLEAKLEYSTIAFQLMPEHFTLSELQSVYETIHDKPVDKRNFRKRVLALEHIQATDRKRRNGSHRPARLYRYTARSAIEILK